MVITKEILSDYKEAYEKAEKLVNEESKSDPVTQPYRSHYAARDTLLELKLNLKNTLDSVLADKVYNVADVITYQIILAFVCRNLGRIYVFTEEMATGEKMFLEALDLLNGKEKLPEAIIPYVGALNELGIIYANRSDYKVAYEKLIEAERCYKEFKRSQKEPLTLIDICGLPEEIELQKGKEELECLYTLCCFYLAQVFCHLKELNKSAQYCHLTLKRQWYSKSYDSIDFALNAATLSQYFISENMFKEARHHLAAATLIISDYENKLLNPTEELSEQKIESMKETFKHRYADVARCWAKYGLTLLAASKERLFNDDEEKLSTDIKHLQLDIVGDYKFHDMPLEAYESHINWEYCLTFNDAKEIYHFVVKWLDESKEYYKAETEASEYAKIIQDYAELYEHMAFFEEDPKNQVKMHKRRAKYYEELIDLLNPSFYMNVCRTCRYGAGLAHCAILDIKLDYLKANTSPNPQEIQKLNQACHNAIKHFHNYIESYQDTDGNLKLDIDIEDQKTLLRAHFHLSRLYYKIITPDVKLQLENLSNSLKYYEAFLNLCEKLEEVAKTVKGEISVCREMVSLLPLKISNTSKRLGN